MNQEIDFGIKQIVETQGELKRKDNFRPDYNKQQYIKYNFKDEQLIEPNKVIQRNQKQKYQEATETQYRKNNRKQYQNYQRQTNFQQITNSELENPQRNHSNENNQSFCYPYIEGQKNNNNQEANNNNNIQQEKRNNYDYQDEQTNKNYNQKQYPHFQHVKNDQRHQRHINYNQSEQNQSFQYINKYNDYNRQYDNNSFGKQYDRNQRYKQKRRNSDDYGLSEYDIYDEYENNDRENTYGRQKKLNYKNQKFEQYLTEQEIENGKAENEIFEGIYIASEFNFNMSAVKCPIFKKKVYINSFFQSNRAIHGALVAVKILKIQKAEESEDDLEDDIVKQIPINNTNVKQEKEEKVEKNDHEDIDNQEKEIGDDISEVSDIYVVKKKIPLIKIQTLQKGRLVGKIVGIRTNPLENRLIVGKICFNEKHGLQDKQITSKEELINYIEQNFHFQFKCVNKKFPFFNINKLLTFNYELDNQEPVKQFMEYVSQRYFSARYLSWAQNSKYPIVELIKEVGIQGNIDVECEAILIQNSVYENEFSEKCKEEMKTFSPDSIQKERVKRMDLTKEYICSIDPVTARDLDDALSINDLGNDIYEIGVHIADVSHFVIPNSEVDKEAIFRTTSVYLVHRVIPMLPRILCEELCSLNKDVERLAFSVFFKMTSEGDVLWDSFRAAKSVIKSCAQLNYDIVNQIIDGEIEQFSQGEERYIVAEGFDENILKQKVLLLNTIAQKRREKRLEGSITFEKSKLRFILNGDLFPIGYSEEKRGLAQFMVEEWMLLANQFVGKKLIEYDAKTAILRQHISPKDEKLDYYRNLLEACGLEEMAQNLDVSTSRNLKLTMNKVNEIESEEIKLILRFHLLKLMEAAQYFVVDNTQEFEWRHYALDFDVYTHFTSPIRRYPDILVHRRLQIALEQQEIDKTGENRGKLKAIIQHCNDCKLNSRRVSDQCDQLFLALLLKANPVEVDGYILSVTQYHIEIIIPKYNLERRIELKNLKNTYKFIVQEVEQKKQELIVFYNDPNDEQGVRLHFINQFQLVKIKLSGTDTFPIDYQLQIIINNKVLI